jgi:mannose-6-phosphate isomerase-like protein (cupin superfamily)
MDNTNNSGLTAGKLFETAKESPYFRRVLVTERNMQVVTMSLNPKERLEPEIHNGEQLFIVLVGGIEVTNADTGQTALAGPGEFVMIRAGTNHAVRAMDGMTTKLYTIYSPPQHAFNTIHITNPEGKIL